jgi:hypothetical protein
VLEGGKGEVKRIGEEMTERDRGKRVRGTERQRDRETERQRDKEEGGDNERTRTGLTCG